MLVRHFFVNFAVKMKTGLLSSVIVAMLLLSACDGGGKFSVKGTITEAEDSVLYFESMTLSGVVVTDSVRLDEDGTFSFSAKATDYPEFYRLRIARQAINFAVDSTRTINIIASYPTMATGYGIEGYDDNLVIKELAVKQMALQRQVETVLHTPMKRAIMNDSIRSLIEVYKSEVMMDYIYKNPRAASSYYALFQTVGAYLIFNPTTSNNDTKAIAAVATAWQTYYPGTERTENLYNIALENMKNERIVAARAEMSIDEDKIITAGLIDISLQDRTGQVRTLSSLAGKVVMLDFHLFSLEDSPARILSLREMYNKYADRGFEIYQVAVDTDEHYWLQQTKALPWVCVMADNGLSSQCLMHYNVSAVPEYFLIDRDGNLYKRSSQMEDLEQEIKNLLK